jgi:hypothetical protein
MLRIHHPIGVLRVLVDLSSTSWSWEERDAEKAHAQFARDEAWEKRGRDPDNLENIEAEIRAVTMTFPRIRCPDTENEESRCIVLFTLSDHKRQPHLAQAQRSSHTYGQEPKPPLPIDVRLV